MRATDLHITVGLPPMVRINGALGRMSDLAALTPADTTALAEKLLTPKQLEAFEHSGSIDFSRSLPGTSRLRVNVYRQRSSVAMAIRLIPMGVPSLADLGVPAVVMEMARKPHGLILVTGPTGSGKSSTQAGIIGQLNRERALHIITLEDPIEYLHQHGACMINQREIGDDTQSFASGLRSALREDPDVILVGEMRDLETTQIAISAAETGHLVLATLHTPSASQTVDRIIDIFPPHQQAQVRVQLAASIQGVIAQRLLPRSDGTGRVAAFEILIATSAVRNLIREGKTYQLPSTIQTGGRVGMVTMEGSLKSLFRQGIIDQGSYELYSPDFAGKRLAGEPAGT
jgi:twitching motility protein PilT